MKLVKQGLKVLFPIIFWLAVWHIVSLLVGKEVLLPSPFAVIRKLAILITEAEFHISVWYTLLRVVAGYMLGVILGALLAVISFCHEPIGMLISPLFSVIRATPVASFIILALVWIGRDFVPTFTSLLMVMPIVYNGAIAGMRSADKQLIEVTIIHKFSMLKKMRLLYIPSATPYFLSSAKTSLGLAWKSGVAAEVLCALKYSIGGEIYSSKVYLETAELMAWTLCVIVLSLILERIITFTTSYIYKKYLVLEVAYNAHAD